LGAVLPDAAEPGSLQQDPSWRT